MNVDVAIGLHGGQARPTGDRGFDERGLGLDNIDYSLTADATDLCARINGGGKHPQAANKETVNGDVSAAGSFESKSA